ncbi:PWWP domain-containing DNA repair factor 3B isoform X1 [Pseudochaenichthys georgianus]|uniref:PWWP domain-containing DNA repair factor 3B isoform X1 n=1 Tax=Pseudochaenichthys georgianus TaxID=52239 RepID=UPI00146B6EFE|nr:PWWP domain-containing DNA repair factor 3B isoform X1 [Pseudochaenichthys georgianus]
MEPTQDAPLTSTSVRNSSKDFLSNISRTKEVEPESSKFTNQLETSEVDSSCCQSKSVRKRESAPASPIRRLRNRVVREQIQTRSQTRRTPAKRRRGRTRNVPMTERTTSQSSEHSTPDAAEKEDSVLSSDLSIELSHHEEQVPYLFCQDDNPSEEDEELPSFLMQQEKNPPAITGGAFVWYKYRSYPFWPASVKSVNRKQKKASIIFIDDPLIHQKKGLAVALKTLKPFGSEEDHELECKAKEKYNAAMEWCLDLITDYRIKIACGSFSGSFLEYFAHDMSYPLRRKYPKAASERLTIPSESADVIEAPFQDYGFSDQHEEVSTSLKRLLPDRSHATHDRANKKLVHFIVKQRMVEGRLLSVISGQQPSRWLRSFLSDRRRMVNVFLEDDQQLDQVYRYLNELYTTAEAIAPCLHGMDMQLVSFVLDVLLPEAIIYAIAGVDNVPVKKAEEKYLKGRCISKRERQEFDLMIEQQMRNKFKCQSTSPELLDDPIS